MSRVQLLSCDIDGAADPIYLDAIADVQSLHLIYGQNGPQAATWDLYADANFNHRALTPGRIVYGISGAGVPWSGTLTEPTRGTPWQCAADGIASIGANFPAYAPTTGDAFKLNEIIDAATGTLGLTSWARGMSLPGAPAGTDMSGVSTVNDALSTVAQATGNIWKVTPAQPGQPGVVTMTTSPTVPAWMLLATSPAGGRTLDTFVSLYVATYLDETTRAQTSFIVGGASKYGTFAQPLDLTPNGYISLTHATALANAQLTLNGPRLPYTGTFTVTQGQVLTLGGAPADLVWLDPAGLYLIQQLDPDAAGELDLTVPTMLLMSSIDVDVDAGTAELTPWNSVAA